MALIGSALGLAGCGLDEYSWHQKMTVVIATPSGDRTGSAVTEVRVSVGRQAMSGNERWFSVKGEAVVVEVAPGKYVFALLSGSKQTPHEYLAELTWAGSYPEATFTSAEPYTPEKKWGPVYAAIQKMKDARDIPAQYRPMLVTFTDINDPKSVKEVKPGKVSEALGPGYALKSITLEITDEPVTDEIIEKLLKRLAALNGSYLGGGFTDKDAPLGLHGGNFKTGYHK